MKYGIIGMGILGNQLFKFLTENGYSEDEFVYFDDLLYKNKSKNAYPFNYYKKEEFENLDFFIGLGYKNLKLKKEILEFLETRERSLPNIIHPTCYVHPTSILGKAVYMYPACIIDQNTVINSGVLLNNRVTVSHDSFINSSCFLAPSVTICGNVNIGECTFIGAASVISNGIFIGRNCLISVGSTVIFDLGDNQNFKFNQKIEKQLKLK